MSSPLLVVGSVAFDTVETRAGRRDEILGGSATYISLSAGNFCPVNLVAVVGAGDFPTDYEELLTSRRVDLTGLERVRGRTFRWSGVYAEDFSSRRTLDTQLGVFESFSPRIPESYRGSRFAVLGNIGPSLQLEVLDALDETVFVAADTMNLWIETARERLEEVIRRVDLMVVNDEEAWMLTKERQIARSARKILEKGPSMVVIKRGEHGAYLFTPGSTFFSPAMPLFDVVDPTGAGDTFIGGLMGFVAACGDASDRAIREGMLYGAALASVAVEGFGPESLASLDSRSIDSRFKKLRDLVAID